MRCACLSRQRSVSSRRWSRRWKPRRSSTSAGRSRDCRWRCSLRRHGRACCRAMRSPPSCVREPSFCMRPTLRTRRDTQASRSCSTSRGDCSAPIERDALSRLSVFHGGFSPEAARAVAGASLPVLGALADKSLLRKDGARIFIASAGAAAGGALGSATARRARATQAAHAAYFHRLLAQLQSPVGSGRARGAADDRCRVRELPARVGLVDRARRRLDALKRSSATLLDYCRLTAVASKRAGVAAQSDRIAELQADAELASLLLSRRAHLEYRLNRFADAEATATRALEATRRSRDYATKKQALNVARDVCVATGPVGDARRYFKQALESASPEDHAHWTAVTLDHLALVEKRLGKLRRSAAAVAAIAGAAPAARRQCGRGALPEQSRFSLSGSAGIRSGQRRTCNRVWRSASATALSAPADSFSAI